MLNVDRLLGPLTRDDTVSLLPALLNIMSDDAIREALAGDWRDTILDILVDLTDQDDEEASHAG